MIFVARVPWDSKLPDFQVPRYLKSGLGRARLGPWVGPWQCCSGARRRAAGAPAQYCHGPPQGSSPARPRPDLRYLGTWKSRSLESHGTLATKISEFWTYWNPCVKDFRILDLLEPLRQRFPDFQITPEILSIYGSLGRVVSHTQYPKILTDALNLQRLWVKCVGGVTPMLSSSSVLSRLF